MTGILCFELADWVAAKSALTEARNIYDKLASITSVDDSSIYRSRMDEIVPSLRYCAYNIGGDASAKMDLSKDLKGLRGHVQVGTYEPSSNIPTYFLELLNLQKCKRSSRK